MIFRTGNKIIFKDRKELAAFSTMVKGLAIDGSGVKCKTLNDAEVDYLASAFKILNIDVYETDTREQLDLTQIQALTPIAHIEGDEFVTINNTKDGKHWLILVCTVDLEA